MCLKKEKMNKREIKEIIKRALKEDIGRGDISAAALKGRNTTLFLTAKEEGILSGIDVFKEVFYTVDKKTKITETKKGLKDGASFKKGEKLLKISGEADKILSSERVALNLLGRMSGIATKTNHLTKLLKGTKIKLADTRKTMPNLRVIDKYSVKIGGGINHRYNLADAVMLKDNHIKAAGSIKKAVSLIKKDISFVYKIEVETENIKMVKEALEENVDIIMLDNMPKTEMKKAVSLIRKQNKKIIIEVSGNINEKKIKEIRDLDIDIVSSGEITHSVKNIDFSLK